MSSGSAAAQKSAAERKGNRLLEVVAVALLGVATIGSAWCGYQASRWNGRQTDLSRSAVSAQTEGARLFGLATQTVSYDSSTIAQYAQAVSTNNQALMNFYRTTLIRPALLPLIDRWQQQIQAGEAPTNLLQDQAYLDEQLAPYRANTAKVEAVDEASAVAGDHSDQYILTTLLLASALFFAGLTTSFRVRFARLLLLFGASMLIAYAASRLVNLPAI
jgi:hypothetical protein